MSKGMYYEDYVLRKKNGLESNNPSYMKDLKGNNLEIFFDRVDDRLKVIIYMNKSLNNRYNPQIKDHKLDKKWMLVDTQENRALLLAEINRRAEVGYKSINESIFESRK